NGDEDVGARHLLASRGLHMNDRTMDHALEARRRRGFRRAFDHERAERRVEILCDALLELFYVDIARAHHGGRIAILRQREQQVLERRVLVTALVSELERTVERGFQ